MRAIGDQQHHPVIVHSGFKPSSGAAPRCGDGHSPSGWFHQKGLGTEPDKEFDQLPFTAESLIEHLKTMITGLAPTITPRRGCPGWR